MRSKCCIRPTTSPNSPAGYVPAPCEASVHAQHHRFEPVTIKSRSNARSSIAGSNEGWIRPQVPEKHSGQVGRGRSAAGAAGLACAQQLARAGHAVTVFEKSDRIGGLLRYGIPGFQDGKAPDQPSRGADGSRGRPFQNAARARSGSKSVVHGACRRISMRSFWRAGRKKRVMLDIPGAEFARRPAGNGISHPAEQAQCGRRRGARRTARQPDGDRISM